MIEKAIQKLQKHPLILLSTIIAGFTTLVVGIAMSIQSGINRREVDELKAEISHLSLTTGETNNINLSNFFVYRNGLGVDQLPDGCLFDEENLFYYSNSDYWEYKKMNNAQFICMTNDVKLPEEFSDLGDNYSHIWISDYKIEISNEEYVNEIENIESVKNLNTPQDSVQLFTFTEAPRYLHQFVKLTRFSNKNSFYKTRDLENSYKVVDSISYRDLGFKHMVSNFIEENYNKLFFDYPHSFGFTELNNISMSDNWLLMTSITMFKVNSKEVNRRTIYSYRDYYVLYSELNTYVLEIQTPSFEPIRRGEQFKELNSWLSYFKAVLK